MDEIDTSNWTRGCDPIVFDLTTMSFNGISAQTSVAELSRLGKPDFVERSILHYYDLGLTAITNTQTTPYFYFYARDNAHGFGLKTNSNTIGGLGGPYRCFHADFTLNGDFVGRDLHTADACRLLRLVNTKQTPDSHPQKYQNCEKRIALNNESNRHIDICYNSEGIVTHFVLA